ncbi:MAG: type II toxin-antitoxin system RelE/ParE family toxin [Planctomycetes bacterium]|nr:type II toxin-antitoxin system RelE/ParE family toxin [Planctomycetota bacterium]
MRGSSPSGSSSLLHAGVENLRQIAAFIAQDSPENAAHFVQRIRERAIEVGRFPNSGRVIPEIGDPMMREVFVGSYRIMYQVHESSVRILRIRHGARDSHQ